MLLSLLEVVLLVVGQLEACDGGARLNRLDSLSLRLKPAKKKIQEMSNFGDSLLRDYCVSTTHLILWKFLNELQR